MAGPIDPRRLFAALIAAATLLLAGCAGVLPQVERTPSQTLVAASDAPLVAAVREAQLPAEASGVWPLMQASAQATSTGLRKSQVSRPTIFFVVAPSTLRTPTSLVRRAAE